MAVAIKTVLECDAVQFLDIFTSLHGILSQAIFLLIPLDDNGEVLLGFEYIGLCVGYVCNC
jgi:hypothetical protein